ncbi:uncharacterized protein LOC141664199 isoform X1 [Apium graveolens]|uniref:uncharacterized protein LOC141664199 isoform X1 n=1 Tax=Apium graveolens TaxID=4045 RepID=UPI003D7A32DF
MLLSHHCKRESLLFDYEREEESKVVLKHEKTGHIVEAGLRRKIKILDDYVKQLVESDDEEDFAAIQKIEDMIIGEPNLVAGLKPLVFERLVEVLVDGNKETTTKGSAAFILGFANFDECSVGMKEKAIKVLVKLMSDDCDMISIPALKTLTRLARVSADYASYMIEKGALEGALAIHVDPINYPNLQIIQELAKFLALVVCQVKIPSHKVHLVVPILDKILQIRESEVRYMVRACYALLSIAVESWINEGEICKNLILFIGYWNNMAAYSAFEVVAYIVESGNSSHIEILIKKHKFLQYLDWSEICRKPKTFQKEVCRIISKLAVKGGIFINNMDKARVRDYLSKLLEADDIKVRSEAACTICNVFYGDI